jgi:uncharacterized protein (TIGR02246 family)
VPRDDLRSHWIFSRISSAPLSLSVAGKCFRVVLTTFVMRYFVLVITVFLYLAVPLRAQEHNEDTFDSLLPQATSEKTDAQLIYELLRKQFELWNAKDIEGFLEAYWKSPNLLSVVDSEQFNGWQQLHDSYFNGYPDKNSMGTSTPARIQIRLIHPNIATSLTWWSISYPDSKKKVVGNTTAVLERFEDGWKIIISHSSTAEEGV